MNTELRPGPTMNLSPPVTTSTTTMRADTTPTTPVLLSDDSFSHSEEEEEEGGHPVVVKKHRGLDYDDPDHTRAVLHQLNKLFKRGQFCDATLIVGDHETVVHRAVLASASSVFFELFMKPGVEEGKEDRDQNVFKLKDVSWERFSYLLDFMYTGRLLVPDEDVRAVYKLAEELRVPAAAAACAEYLIARLTPDNCLGIRAFASDDSFRERVDSYINNNIQYVTNSKKFYGLNKVTLEIVGTDENLVVRTNHEELLSEVLLWLRQKMAASKNNMEALKEDMIVLYLNVDNKLTDCAEVEDTNLRENGLVQDYVKLNRKKQSGAVTPNKQGPGLAEANNGTYRKFNINPERPIVELEWSIVATMKTKDRTYITLAMLNGQLATLYMHYRSATSAGSASDDPESPVHSASTNIFDGLSDLSPLATMTTNRCAFGLKALNGQLFACGGYDRGECLKSAEVYDVATNEWRLVGEMKSPRGRFSIGINGKQVYACGGSSGNNDVKILECYDSESEKWQIIAEIPQSKASPGIAMLEGKLYVLGGCIGQSTVATCETYDLTTGLWHGVPIMNMPRYQVAITVLQEKIYAIGGTNGWKCLNEVEVFDPKLGKWSFLPPMNVCRRGAGVDTYKGKIYVVGGNDGVTALNSMEVYDPDMRTWSIGPILGNQRANCGIACLAGKLFAVGGFNGKSFLATMEVLDLDGEDGMWSSYSLKRDPATNVATTNGDIQSDPATNVATTNGDIQGEHCDKAADSTDINGGKGGSTAASKSGNKGCSGMNGDVAGCSEMNGMVEDLKTVSVSVSVASPSCSSDLKQDVKMEAARTS